jgi:hypothetical protein
VRGKRNDARWVSALLALLWLWMAIAYHVTFFVAINRAAVLFAVLFGAQALLFTTSGVWKRSIQFTPRWNLRGVLGATLMLYALVVYPLLGALLGHRYPEAPTFGLPCPTTIFTLALLLWADPTLPRTLLVVPLLWSVIGTSAAFTLGVHEDLGLAVAGVIAATLLFPKVRRVRDRTPMPSPRLLRARR